MRRELTAAVLAVAAGLAHADDPCMLAFVQARDTAPAVAGGPDWAALNQRFNAAVVATLQADGRLVNPASVATPPLDAQGQAQALLAEADKLGCRTLTETAVYVQNDMLVLRLRLYPLLAELGNGTTIVGLRVGTPLFVTQRDLPAHAVTRIKPDVLGEMMAAEYLRHDRR